MAKLRPEAKRVQDLELGDRVVLEGDVWDVRGVTKVRDVDIFVYQETVPVCTIWTYEIRYGRGDREMDREYPRGEVLVPLYQGENVEKQYKQVAPADLRVGDITPWGVVHSVAYHTLRNDSRRGVYQIWTDKHKDGVYVNPRGSVNVEVKQERCGGWTVGLIGHRCERQADHLGYHEHVTPEGNRYIWHSNQTRHYKKWDEQ